MMKTKIEMYILLPNMPNITDKTRQNEMIREGVGVAL